LFARLVHVSHLQQPSPLLLLLLTFSGWLHQLLVQLLHHHSYYILCSS
jgi:hypothetical protein